MPAPSLALPFSADPRPRMRWWPLLVFALLKLVLVSHDEIRTVSADDAGYAQMAANWYWGAAYAPYSYSRQPLYPLFISVSQVFGIPYRIWIELAWIGACIASARAMNAAGVRRGAALLAGVVMLFHPTVLTLFTRLLPDSLYAIGWMLLLTALAAAVTQRSLGAVARWAGVAAVGAMIATNARPESILVWGVLAMAGTFIVLARLLAWAPDRLWWRLALCVFMPFAVAQALTQSFAAVNHARIGVWATNDLTMPGFASFYRAILAIPPDHPSLLLPIPRDVRDRAYAASPSFRRLEPFLEGGPAARPYADACFERTGVKGEFGGWTVWALRRAAWSMNNDRWPDAAKVDAYYARCAAELRQAMLAGDLPSRFVPVSFVPPEWRLLAAQLPTSLRHCWRSLTHLGGYFVQQSDLAPSVVGTFDAAAGRRITLKAMNDATPVPYSVWHQPKVGKKLFDIELAISKAARRFIPYAPFLAFAGTLVTLACPWRHPRHWSPRRRGVTVVLLILWGAGLARLFFIAVLDANAVGSQERYMFPAGIALALLIPACISGMVESFRELRAGRPVAATEPAPAPAATP